MNKQEIELKVNEEVKNIREFLEKQTRRLDETGSSDRWYKGIHNVSPNGEYVAVVIWNDYNVYNEIGGYIDIYNGLLIKKVGEDISLPSMIQIEFDGTGGWYDPDEHIEKIVTVSDTGTVLCRMADGSEKIYHYRR